MSVTWQSHRNVAINLALAINRYNILLLTQLNLKKYGIQRYACSRIAGPTIKQNTSRKIKNTFCMRESEVT